MPSKPDLQRLLEFQKLLLEFRSIERVVPIPDKEAAWENDTEHSYNLAMTAWFLSPHFPRLNKEKLISLALVHDLVEVHAGDTFVYGDRAHLATKKDREAKAVKQLENDWQDFPEMLQDIVEYEDLSSPEAKFVYALDKIMPTMMIYLAEGSLWKQRNISLKMLQDEKRKKIPKTSEIYQYWQQLEELFVNNPKLFTSIQQR